MVTVPPTATYERGLQSMELAKALTDHDRQLLRTLYAGPDHSLTTMEIAHAMGWDSHSPVNATYGKFAQRLAQRMQWVVPPGLPQITTVATFEGAGPDDPHTRWTMRPELVAALETRRLVFKAKPKPPEG
jgi:hypothetical protein